MKPNTPNEIKTGKSRTNSTQRFPNQLMEAISEHQPILGENLLIVEAAITLSVSNVWLRRGASAPKIVKNRCRSRLHNNMLEAMIQIQINGPSLGSPSMISLVNRAFQTWLDRKNRKKERSQTDKV